MAEQTIISWNATNWITIVLMAALGFFVIGTAVKIYKSKMGS